MGWGEWGWGWQKDPTPSSLPALDWNSDHVGLDLGILGCVGGEKVPPQPPRGTGSQLTKAGLGDRSANEHWL